MTEIWSVVLIGPFGAFVVLVVLLVVVCLGVRQEAERLTGQAPTRLAAVARRAAGLHVLTPDLPLQHETSGRQAGHKPAHVPTPESRVD